MEYIHQREIIINFFLPFNWILIRQLFLRRALHPYLFNQILFVRAHYILEKYGKWKYQLVSHKLQVRSMDYKFNNRFDNRSFLYIYRFFIVQHNLLFKIVHTFLKIDDAILKANEIIQKAGTPSNIKKEAESPELNLSSVIEAKVGKLVEAKIIELLGT